MSVCGAYIAAMFKTLTLQSARGDGVAINQRGEVIVAECDEHCVSVFSPSGEKLRTFGSHGSDQGRQSY